MTLTEFLLARIDEDEAWWNSASLDGPSAEVLLRKQLRDCEAKRAMLDIHAIYEADGLGRCGACADRYVAVSWDGLCDEAKILASVYADHPDYREEWSA